MAVKIKQFNQTGRECRNKVMEDLKDWVKEKERSKRLNILSMSQSEVAAPGNMQSFTLTIVYEEKPWWWPF